MAPTSDRMTISLRISPSLHAKIAQEAGGKSVNAAIIQRLERSFEEQPPSTDFHFLDAFKRDVVPRARVTARIGMAIAEGLEAVDLLLIDEELAARISAQTGQDKRVHDAAKAAIEAAFPAEGLTWRQIAEALATLGAKAPAPALALRSVVEQRLAETPTKAAQVAL